MSLYIKLYISHIYISQINRVPSTCRLAALALQVFTFDLDIIKLQCLFGKDDPVVNFLITILILPFFVAALACMSVLLRVLGVSSLSKDRFLNSVGLVGTVAYTSVTIMVL